MWCVIVNRNIVVLEDYNKPFVTREDAEAHAAYEYGEEHETIVLPVTYVDAGED